MISLSIHQDIAQQISRELKILLLEAASHDAVIGLGTDPGVDEALSRAANPLRGGIVQAELIAEAQRWFLAALASDPAIPRHFLVSPILAKISSVILAGPTLAVSPWRLI